MFCVRGIDILLFLGMVMIVLMNKLIGEKVDEMVSKLD